MVYVVRLVHLDLLARFAPQLFGRALSLETMGEALARSGRSDRIDAKTPEMRLALEAFARLLRLRDTHPDDAAILAYLRVICGPEARKSGDPYLEVARLGQRRPSGPLRADDRARLLLAGLQRYQRAMAVWDACA